MSERREVKEEDDIKLALLFQCTSCRSLVLSFLCTMQHFFPKCYSWFLIQPERGVIHTSEKAVLPKQISSFTLPRVFYFNSFEGEILVNNTSCGGVPDPYAVQGSQRTRQNTWLKSSCFHSVAGDGGRTNEETRHTLKKKKDICTSSFCNYRGSWFVTVCSHQWADTGKMHVWSWRRNPLFHTILWKA